MKRYVVGYRVVDDPAALVQNWQRYEVGYTAMPEWVMSSRSEAEGECATLQSWHVEVGPHRCDFEVEALEGEEFAVVCTSHPENALLVPSSGVLRSSP